jgi:hypothetical protein
MLLVSILLGCLVTIYSSRLFVIQTENVHSQLITYERGLPFPYLIETALVRRGRLRAEGWWPPDPYYPHPTYTMGYEILTIPLLSSVLSNTVAVAGIIGILLIRAKQSSLKADRVRDQLGRKMAA